MPDKLTDKEIVKALEQRKNTYIIDINKELTTISIADVLDLINRQKAENSNLTSRLTSLQNDLTSAKAEIGLKKNKYRLQKALNQSEDYRTIAKAEAIKEFAERLKTMPKHYYFHTIDGTESLVSFDRIDNLLKELVGE